MTAKLMTYSGMTGEIARALVSATGTLYPAFAPLVGALGAFLTGSGTNANVLFGPLQTAAAKGLNPSNPDLALWLAAINSGAAGIGKMFSPQSIAIAIGAVSPALESYLEEKKIDQKEADELRNSIQASVILQSVLKYFIFFIVADGMISFFGQGFISIINKAFF